MSAFDALRQTAIRMIRARGTVGTLARSTGGLTDPVTQMRSTATHQAEFRVIVLPPASAERLGVNLDGRAARELYFAHEGQTMIPAPGDVLTVGARAFPLFWTRTYDPDAGGAVLTIAFAEAKG